MSERKIVVPEGMLKAVDDRRIDYYGPVSGWSHQFAKDILDAFLLCRRCGFWRVIEGESSMNEPAVPRPRPGRPSLFTVDDLLRPDDEEHNDQIREAYCRGSVATANTMNEDSYAR